MEIKQTPFSTASIRLGIQDVFSNVVKSIPSKTLKKSFANFVNVSFSQIKKVSILLIELMLSVLKSLTSRLSLTKNLLRKKTSPGLISPSTNPRRKFNFPGNKQSLLLRNKFLKPLLITAVAVVILFGLSKLISGIGGSGSVNKIEVSGAKASQVINREFLFPLRDGGGENLSEIKFFIEKAELRDEIVVKGKRATSIKGRVFLIITAKITNQYRQAITMNTKDYVRLSVNGNEEEWLAPDIHNDPVEIQAISTKYIRIGFPINEKDRNLILRVGEINGEKVRIPMELK